MDATSEAYAALARAQAKFPAIVKDAINPHFNKPYASLAGIIAAIRKPLNEEGFCIIHRMVEGGMETILAHSSGGMISSGPLPVITGKNDMQALGSGLSYAKRYGIQMVAAAPADDDDDGNAAVASMAKSAKKNSPPPAAPKPAPAPKATRDEQIASCTTPQQLATKLQAWKKIKTVGEDLAGWADVVRKSVAHATKMTASGDAAWADQAAAEPLHALLDDIARSVEFAKEGGKLFDTTANATEGGL